MKAKIIMFAAAFLVFAVSMPIMPVPENKVYASEVTDETPEESVIYDSFGGGYAASGQIEGVGFTTEVYDTYNGLPTSDAMYIMGANDGHIWIGGYSGVILYDGTLFERLDTGKGLTSARAIFEDSEGRIWVGTNDNGVVIIDGIERTHITYKDGLPSSSIRMFAEDESGNVFVGTTSGVCYIDKDFHVRKVKGFNFINERVLKLDKDLNGRIYGQTSNGFVFAIDNCEVTEYYNSENLGIEKITTIMADPKTPGKVWYGTEGGLLYCGEFGADKKGLSKRDVSPIKS
nr:hybrid sensor histidine kinase/response regulator [Lachnospiraceae bacterium]